MSESETSEMSGDLGDVQPLEISQLIENLKNSGVPINYDRGSVVERVLAEDNAAGSGDEGGIAKRLRERREAENRAKDRPYEIYGDIEDKLRAAEAKPEDKAEAERVRREEAKKAQEGKPLDLPRQRFVNQRLRDEAAFEALRRGMTAAEAAEFLGSDWHKIKGLWDAATAEAHEGVEPAGDGLDGAITNTDQPVGSIGGGRVINSDLATVFTDAHSIAGRDPDKASGRFARYASKLSEVMEAAGGVDGLARLLAGAGGDVEGARNIIGARLRTLTDAVGLAGSRGDELTPGQIRAFFLSPDRLVQGQSQPQPTDQSSTTDTSHMIIRDGQVDQQSPRNLGSTPFVYHSPDTGGGRGGGGGAPDGGESAGPATDLTDLGLDARGREEVLARIKALEVSDDEARLLLERAVEKMRSNIDPRSISRRSSDAIKMWLVTAAASESSIVPGEQLEGLRSEVRVDPDQSRLAEEARNNPLIWGRLSPEQQLLLTRRFGLDGTPPQSTVALGENSPGMLRNALNKIVSAGREVASERFQADLEAYRQVRGDDASWGRLDPATQKYLVARFENGLSQSEAGRIAGHADGSASNPRIMGRLHRIADSLPPDRRVSQNFSLLQDFYNRSLTDPSVLSVLSEQERRFLESRVRQLKTQVDAALNAGYRTGTASRPTQIEQRIVEKLSGIAKAEGTSSEDRPAEDTSHLVRPNREDPSEQSARDSGPPQFYHSPDIREGGGGSASPSLIPGDQEFIDGLYAAASRARAEGATGVADGTTDIPPEIQAILDDTPPPDDFGESYQARITPTHLAQAAAYLRERGLDPASPNYARVRDALAQGYAAMSTKVIPAGGESFVSDPFNGRELRLMQEANRVHQEGRPTLSLDAETSEERSQRELVRQQAQELLRRAGSGVQAEASAQPLSEEDIGLLSDLILRADAPEAEQPAAEGQPPRQERGRLSPQEIRDLVDDNVQGAAQEILARYHEVLHPGQRRMLEGLVSESGYLQSPFWEGELRSLVTRTERLQTALNEWRAKPEWQRNLIRFKRGAQAVASVTAAVVGAGTAAVASAAAAPFVALSELNASRNEAARQIAELNAVEVGDPGYADRVRLVNSYEGADAASNYTPDQLAAMAARYSQFGSPDFDPNDRQPQVTRPETSSRPDNKTLVKSVYGLGGELGGAQMKRIARGLERGRINAEQAAALIEARRAEVADEAARFTAANAVEGLSGKLNATFTNPVAEALKRGEINPEQAAALIEARRAEVADEAARFTAANAVEGLSGKLNATFTNPVAEALKRGEINPEQAAALIAGQRAKLKEEGARDDAARSVERLGSEIGGWQANEIAERVRDGTLTREEAARLVERRRGVLVSAINDLIDGDTQDVHPTTPIHYGTTQAPPTGERHSGGSTIAKAALGLGLVLSRAGRYLGGLRNAGPVTRGSRSQSTPTPSTPTPLASTTGGEVGGGRSNRDSEYYGSYADTPSVSRPTTLEPRSTQLESTTNEATPLDAEAGRPESAGSTERAIFDGQDTVRQSDQTHTVETPDATDERIVDTRSSGGRQGKIGLPLPQAYRERPQSHQNQMPPEERSEEALARFSRIREGAEVYSGQLPDGKNDSRLDTARIILTKIIQGEQLSRKEESIAQILEELAETA